MIKMHTVHTWILSIITMAMCIGLAASAFAQSCPSGQQVNPETGECYTPIGSGGSGSGGSGGGGGGGSGGSGAPSTNQLINPLGPEADTIQAFLLRIIDVLLVFALPVIIFFIMYAGYLFVTARGDVGQIGDAKSALTWAVIGGVIILGARLIISIIQGTVSAL